MQAGDGVEPEPEATPDGQWRLGSACRRSSARAPTAPCAWRGTSPASIAVGDAERHHVAGEGADGVLAAQPPEHLQAQGDAGRHRAPARVHGDGVPQRRRLFDRIAECGKLDEGWRAATSGRWRRRSRTATSARSTTATSSLENMPLDASDAVKIADFTSPPSSRSTVAVAPAPAPRRAAARAAAAAAAAGRKEESAAAAAAGPASPPPPPPRLPPPAPPLLAPRPAPGRGRASRVRDDQPYLHTLRLGHVRRARGARSTLQRARRGRRRLVVGVILFAMLSGTLLPGAPPALSTPPSSRRRPAHAHPAPPHPQVAAAGKCARFAIVAQHGLALCAAHDFSKAAGRAGRRVGPAAEPAAEAALTSSQ